MHYIGVDLWVAMSFTSVFFLFSYFVIRNKLEQQFIADENIQHLQREYVIAFDVQWGP